MEAYWKGPEVYYWKPEEEKQNCDEGCSSTEVPWLMVSTVARENARWLCLVLGLNARD